MKIRLAVLLVIATTACASGDADEPATTTPTKGATAGVTTLPAVGIKVLNLNNDSAMVEADCPDTVSDWWHFIIAPNNGTYSFESMELNLDGTTIKVDKSGIQPNGRQWDNVFVKVPSGYELSSLRKSGSSATISPNSGKPRLQLSHLCVGSGSRQGQDSDDTTTTEPADETTTTTEVKVTTTQVSTDVITPTTAPSFKTTTTEPGPGANANPTSTSSTTSSSSSSSSSSTSSSSSSTAVTTTPKTSPTTVPTTSGGSNSAQGSAAPTTAAGVGGDTATSSPDTTSITDDTIPGTGRNSGSTGEVALVLLLLGLVVVTVRRLIWTPRV